MNEQIKLPILSNGQIFSEVSFYSFKIASVRPNPISSENCFLSYAGLGGKITEYVILLPYLEVMKLWQINKPEMVELPL